MPLLPEGSTYTGIDISKDLISEARNVYNNTDFKAEFIIADLYEYNVLKKYDISICQTLLRHLNSPEVVLKKMVVSTKKSGKVICVDVNRVIEEAGFFNSTIEYDPFKQFKVFEKVWKSEQQKGGRDYSIGLKVPSMMSKLGLNNVQVRLNDKITIASNKAEVLKIRESKGWGKEFSIDDASKTREMLINRGASISNVDAYID